MIKALFFDFDMTLVNSRAIARKSYLDLSKIAGIKPSIKGFDDYVGRRVSESIDFFSRKKPEIKNKLRLKFMTLHTKNPLKVQIFGKKALLYLRDKGIKIIIISRNSKKVIERIVHAHRLPYSLIIADEDLKKGEEKHQAIIRTLKKLRMNKNEIYYVGDHINDIREAKKADVKIISVTTGVYKAKDLLPLKPDFIISDLNDIRKIV
jgi:phosphoglycolate phosphatase-like HAD superfamily hydrolase